MNASDDKRESKGASEETVKIVKETSTDGLS